MTSSTTPLVGRTTTSGPAGAPTTGDVRGVAAGTTMAADEPFVLTWATTASTPSATASVAARRTAPKAALPARPHASPFEVSQWSRPGRGDGDWTDHGRAAVSAGSGGVRVLSANLRSRASMSESGSIIGCPLPPVLCGGAVYAGQRGVGT